MWTRSHIQGVYPSNVQTSLSRVLGRSASPRPEPCSARALTINAKGFGTICLIAREMSSCGPLGYSNHLGLQLYKHRRLPAYLIPCRRWSWRDSPTLFNVRSRLYHYWTRETPKIQLSVIPKCVHGVYAGRPSRGQSSMTNRSLRSGNGEFAGSIGESPLAAATGCPAVQAEPELRSKLDPD
jgi:hypothetical protein